MLQMYKKSIYINLYKNTKKSKHFTDFTYIY